MKLFFLGCTLLMFCVHAQAATEIMRRNIKLPSQEVLQKQELTPAAAGTANVLAAKALGAAPVVYTSFVAQPDYPRNLVVTPAGTTADVKAGNVVITGRNSDGALISETFVFTDNIATAVTGNKAFAIVESISMPIGDSPYGGTASVGFGAKMGLQKCLDGAGYYIKGLVDGVALTSETVASDATVIESNTVIPNPAPNGTRKFNFLYVQNYRCAE